MLYEEERKDIIRICLEMQEKKYFLGTWGNVSIRVGNHIILTPSRIGYNDMTPESEETGLQPEGLYCVW